MILVTGADGFIGTALVSELKRRGISCRAVARVAREGYVGIGDINPTTDWRAALDGVDAVVHLASRAHVKNEASAEEARLFQASTEATLNLARQAAATGVKRLVFISSIKVNGEATERDRPFTAEDSPNPQNLYGRTKLAAEQGLFAFSKDSGLEITVIRPPLVYGPGVKANFATMLAWVDRGLPLPLGAVNNKRSFVFVDNLADLIILAVSHPAAAGEVFLVSDGEDISTSELLRRMAKALGRASRMLPVPTPVLTLAAAAVGRRGVASRLTESLVVDVAKTRQRLGWRPRVGLTEGLQQTASAFLRTDAAIDPMARIA
jgi:UDP-N-acetyl-alpha-D-quinovosamine dehydrogenase